MKTTILFFSFLIIICVPGVANAIFPTCINAVATNYNKILSSRYNRVLNQRMVWQFCMAIETGDKETLAQLVSDGLDRILTDNDFYTALIFAVKAGHLEIVQFLSKHLKIVDINLRDNDGYTALMLAVKAGHLEIVQFLSKHPQVDINLRDNDGYTALMLAELKGYKDIAKILSTPRY